MDPRTFSPQELQELLNRARIQASLEEEPQNEGRVLSRRKSTLGNRQTEIFKKAYSQPAQTAAEALSEEAQDPDSRYFREYLNSLITDGGGNQTDSHDREEEVRSLRRKLDEAQRAMKRAEVHEFDHPYEQIYESLKLAGLGKSHAAVLVRHAQKHLSEHQQVNSRQIMHLIKSELSTMFKDYNSYISAPSGKTRYSMLMGSTGVGKTSTIIKLATKSDMLKPGRVAIVSTDSYRLAASRELEKFSEITGIPFYMAASLAELSELKPTLDEFDSVLIDTPGRSPSFPGFLQEMKQISAILGPTDLLLTLSLTADLDDLFLASGVFTGLQPTGLIFTKMDETCKLGKMVTVSAELGVPIAFIADGQKIPEDLHAATGMYIWEKLMNAIESR